MWRFLAFKTKDKKTKRTPAANTRKAGRPFPRQNVPRKRGGGAPFVSAARIWSLGARLNNNNNKRIPLGGSSQKSHASKLRGLGTGRAGSLPLSLRVPGQAERAPPGEAPAPPAGIPGMSPVREASGRSSRQREGVKPGISRVLLHKFPSSFSSPVKLKPM